MSRKLIVFLLVVVLAIGVILGNIVTRHAAFYSGETKDGYTISYRFGNYVQTDLYE